MRKERKCWFDEHIYRFQIIRPPPLERYLTISKDISSFPHKVIILYCADQNVNLSAHRVTIGNIQNSMDTNLCENTILTIISIINIITKITIFLTAFFQTIK